MDSGKSSSGTNTIVTSIGYGRTRPPPPPKSEDIIEIVIAGCMVSLKMFLFSISLYSCACVIVKA